MTEQLLATEDGDGEDHQSHSKASVWPDLSV
jgi:hypothetical protein